MRDDFQHGDRVELVKGPIVVPTGTTGTVTHLNGDGEPGTSSYWPSLDGNRDVWVEWDRPAEGMGHANWTPKGNISKL